MRPLPKPAITVKDVFTDCISSVNNTGLKKEYSDCTILISAAELDFDTKFPLHQIYLIPRNKIVLGRIDKDEMKKVYDYRMVRSDMPGNKHYTELFSKAPFGKCPLCGVRSVDTLDHYLPKSKYPIFAVTPINLIPSCTPCNKGKLIAFPTTAEEQSLHPYFDNVDDGEWIKASLLPHDSNSFEYSVDLPAGWTPILKDRATGHFNSFKLNALYSAHANEELRGAKKQLQRLYLNHPDLLKEHLKEAYESKLELGLNSWQAVMYKSLLNDAAFLSGGVLI